MTTFIYNIKDHEVYLTALKYERGDSFEIRVNNASPTLIRVGNTAINAADGVGRVKLSALSDGVYTPEVIFNDKSVFLYPIRIFLGKVSIAGAEHVCAALGERSYRDRARIDALEGEVNKLKEAVYGKDIF
jgi:hypothetical protein